MIAEGVRYLVDDRNGGEGKVGEDRLVILPTRRHLLLARPHRVARIPGETAGVAKSRQRQN